MKLLPVLIALLFLLSAYKSTQGKHTEEIKPITYLALGDSYTIGESVCDGCAFPDQLKTALETTLKQTVRLKLWQKQAGQLQP